MKCPVCSHENEGGNFCEECGARLDTGANQQSTPAVDSPVNQGQNFRPAQADQYIANQAQNLGSAQGAQYSANQTQNLGPAQTAQYSANQSQYSANQGQNFGQQQGNQQPNRYLENAKVISKMYFRYFIEVLKRPYASSKSVGAEHYLNGIITMVLYALIIPLMTYFGVNSLVSSVNGYGSMLGAEAPKPPFVDFVIKPTFAYAIFILLVATYTFMAIRLGKVNASYKEVVSRFGSFLIPFVAIFLVALIMSLLKMYLFIVLLGFGFSTSIFIVPTLVIASFKKETNEGLDAIYGTLLTYILVIITLVIMSGILFVSLMGTLGGNLSSLFSSFY